MTTLDTRAQLTLIELAKRTADQNLLDIVEVMTETNEILDDALWLEANQKMGHLGTVRNTLPSGTWRRLNKGIARKASSTRQIKEGIGMLEAYSVVDKKLVDLAPNPIVFRSGEDMAFVEGLSQDLADCIFYGDQSTTPEKFDGFTPRYNALSLENVHDTGGTGDDNTSLWIVQWGKHKVHLIYPGGSASMGVKARDLGECTVLDDQATPQEYQAYRTHFEVNAGMFIHDDRCVQRVCNIEVTGSTNIIDDNLIIAAKNNLPYKGVGAVIYCNKTILTQLEILAKDKSNVNWQPGEAFGQAITQFQGIPVRRVDALLNNETTVA